MATETLALRTSGVDIYGLLDRQHELRSQTNILHLLIADSSAAASEKLFTHVLGLVAPPGTCQQEGIVYRDLASRGNCQAALAEMAHLQVDIEAALSGTASDREIVDTRTQCHAVLFTALCTERSFLEYIERGIECQQHQGLGCFIAGLRAHLRELVADRQTPVSLDPRNPLEQFVREGYLLYTLHCWPTSLAVSSPMPVLLPPPEVVTREPPTETPLTTEFDACWNSA